MSDKSDFNGQPRTNIFDYLPDVFKSDINDSFYEMTANRHLTKDDTVHVAGYVGDKATGALIDNQLPEPTVQRQAFQLQPTMYGEIGDQQYVTSFKAFQSQMELIGVDFERMKLWGNALEFNWVPPVNLDMVVNYTDYYWSSPDDLQALPQYLTIESRCKKQQAQLNAYQDLIETNGSTFAIVAMDVVENMLTIDGQYSTLFIPNFQVFLKGTTDVNLANRYMSVLQSSYSAETDQTMIMLDPSNSSIAIRSATAPTVSLVGRYWVDTTDDTVYMWDGADWIQAFPSATGVISLEEIHNTIARTTNCICNGDYGWDMALWDDNGGDWSTSYFFDLKQPTEADWIAINGAPTAGDLWLNSTNDGLYQRNVANTDWVLTIPNWTTVIGSQMFGDVLWDMSQSCTSNLQTMNQWSNQNKWIHKTQMTSFAGARRAQLPILEYDSRLELNEWSKTSYAWKYRELPGAEFNSVANGPTRFELEPIKGYTWDAVTATLYLYSTLPSNFAIRDVDYSRVFVPGFSFAIRDDNMFEQQLTVLRSSYRETVATDPLPSGIFVTAVTISNPPPILPGSGGATNYRLEPLYTSQGQVWRGYHVHWLLDVDNTTNNPAAPQLFNPLITRAVENGDPYETITVVPGVGAVTVGPYYQVYALDDAGSTELTTGVVDLDPSLTTTGLFALAGADQLRVYINDERQYGTFDEITIPQAVTMPAFYTAVGFTTFSSVTYDIVSGIAFNIPLAQYDKVRIEIGAATISDFGMTAVPVRTEPNDAIFSVEVVAGTQPIYQDLTSYKKVEQTKTQTNQYPLFNKYDVIDNTLIDASPLFYFAEDQSAPINTNIQKRIVVGENNNYVFEQSLVEQDNGIIYSYRLLDGRVAESTYWFEPYTNTLKQWNGSVWNQRVAVVNSPTETFQFFDPIVDEQQPSAPVNNMIWYDTKEQVVKQWDGSQWNIIAAKNKMHEGNPTEFLLLEEDGDPTLTTIWRGIPQYQGSSDKSSYEWTEGVYVPAYVDKDRNPVPVGDPNGDWEIPHQWRFNPEHHNRKQIKFDELLTHFRSILQAQPQISNFPGGGIYAQPQSSYQYWLGGTIKDHNDSYDTLMSAINVTNVNPLTVINFARRQYAELLVVIRDMYIRNAVSTFSNVTGESVVDQSGVIAETLIDLYEQNELYAQMFANTSAFDPVTGNGVRNWIATAPMFGLAPVYVPYVITDAKRRISQVIHHDGHRSEVVVTPAERDILSRQICRAPDTRIVGGTLGHISVNQPATLDTDVTAVYGNLRPAVYWFKHQGSNTNLYRFNIIAVSASHPPLVLDGQPLPELTKYYNSADRIVYQVVSGTWAPAGVAGDVSSAWQVVDFQTTLANVLLELEQRLYSVVPDFNQLKFDFDSLQLLPDERAVYQEYLQQQFSNFVVENGITTPYQNVTYAANDAFTWNYSHSVIVDQPRVGGVIPTDVSASWEQLYTDWFNTPYPHLEPWKLQGYVNKPQWWDDEYRDITNTRRWKYNHTTGVGMWANVLNGVVPAGYLLPDDSISSGVVGQVQQYQYVCVNITNSTIAGGYAPDNVLPPYYNTASLTIRSIFNNLGSQIVLPDANYVYGDGGPVEWEWTVSEFHVYDPSVIAFKMQPVRFMHYCFGEEFNKVNNLQVDRLFKKVYSHEDALFHGDIYDTNKLFTARGLNQWYTNLNTYQGFDTNKEFRSRWVDWNPRLTYQFAGMINEELLEISNRFFDVIPADYKIVLANSGIIKDMWCEAFEVALLNIPPSLVRYDNQSEWRLDINSLAPIPRPISYYGVMQYAFTIDPVTNIATATNMPWETGQVVYLSSTVALPAPLVPNQDYYIIKIDNQQFYLAESVADAIDGIHIEFTTSGNGTFKVGQVDSSFQVFGGRSVATNTWYHYVIDRGVVNTFTPPAVITGMQDLINFIDGYVAYQVDNQQVSYNLSVIQDVDPDTGRSVNWQLEVERFIDWAYNLRNSRLSIGDSFAAQVTVPVPSTRIEFNDAVPVWNNTIPVVFSSTGLLPSPLLPNTPYYLIATDNPKQFEISATISPTLSSVIEFTSVGTGFLSVSRYAQRIAFPTFEINPIRSNVWFNTPQGILSNVVDGPYPDIRVQQTIFDQYGRPLTGDQIQVYRQDEQTRVSILSDLVNDMEHPVATSIDPYRTLHIGGAHVFVEGYEHVIVFNDYTVINKLIYDPFLGLNTPRFSMDYYETQNYVLRPSLGGYFLSGNKFIRNMEGQTVDMQLYYDTFRLPENSTVAKYSRNLVGYERGHMPYLDTLNTNAKSQFMFYRGMIQQKGSVNSVKAYINSRHFVSAEIDEFWAWKVAEYGDNRPRVYPRVRLLASDGAKEDVRMTFIANSESSNPYFTNDVNDGFEIVSFVENTYRWMDMPEQRSLLDNSALFLNAQVSSVVKIYIGTVQPSSPVGITYWYDTTTASGQVKQYNGQSWQVIIGIHRQVGSDVYLTMPEIFDDVRILRYITEGVASDVSKYVLSTPPGYNVINSRVVQFVAEFNGIIDVYCINSDASINDPAQIVDSRSQTTVQTVQMWHPARGQHYHIAQHNIDLEHAGDPATYTVTNDVANDPSHRWAADHVDQVWIDLDHLKYVPYYDNKVNSSIDDRLMLWGKLAPWASAKVYKWISTTVSPEQYDSIAASESADLFINQNTKLTGTPRKTVFCRTRPQYQASVTNGSAIIGYAGGPTLSVNDYVLFANDDGNMPSNLTEDTYYVVASTPSANQITIATDIGEPAIVFTQNATFDMVPEFDPIPWVKQPIVSQTLFAAVNVVTLTPSVLTVSNFSDGDIVDVYVNGELRYQSLTVGETTTSQINVPGLVLLISDIIDVVRPIRAVTDEDNQFQPSPNSDDASILTQWNEMVEYSTTIELNPDNTTTVTYYFWVEDQTTNDPQQRASLSVRQTAQQIVNIPVPYIVVQKPYDNPAIVDYQLPVSPYNDQYFTCPVMYRQMILREASQIIVDDERFYIQFTRDMALRDRLHTSVSSRNLQNKHEEWLLIRKHMQSNIDRSLWNKLIESIVGFKLLDPSVRVPALERELYDETYGTDTQYGLEDGQSFVNGQLALATVIAYLQNPNNSFYPIDINSFFATYSFDTPQNIITAMEAIYNTFGAEHVNAIWFETLMDAFTTKRKYKEFMKTSWVALHGVRILEVAGLFDN